MKLMIVESPAKAKKIASFLGDGWRVEASRGHIRDLPRNELGVNIAQDFHPQYETLPRKGNLIRRLSKAMKDAEIVYLATDPDREGEAIAWHVLQVARLSKDKIVHRVTFTAITKHAVLQALEQPQPIDTALVDAQQARRIVDRLVGYLVSPLACKVLDGRLSAGRVQTVCLRLVVEREREIDNFTAQTYWTLTVELAAEGQSFTAKLHHIRNNKPHFKSLEQAQQLSTILKNAQVWVVQIGEQTKDRKPSPPFTTSSLQQAASKRLDLSPERTMQLAQGLYESGLITYHRTDSVTVASDVQQQTLDYITKTYGAAYVPGKPQTYSSPSQQAQEAHEAIRPTNVHHLVNDEQGETATLYGLIWQRFIASQMANAQYLITGAILHAGQHPQKPFPIELRVHRSNLSFDGYLRVYDETHDDTEDDASAMPVLNQGQLLQVVDVPIYEKQTRPSARFTEATLIQMMEKKGIGRPSTFATTLSLLKNRGYVELKEKYLVPTVLGRHLHDFLVTHFPTIFAIDYTAQLETQLDEIAVGKSQRLTVLQNFWKFFQPALAAASQKILTKTTGESCPDCGNTLLWRSGKAGAFLGCSDFPDCTYTAALPSKPLLLQPATEE